MLCDGGWRRWGATASDMGCNILSPEEAEQDHLASTGGKGGRVESEIVVAGMKGMDHTDLILDKPAGQLLRRTVSFPLEAPDQDGPIDGLPVERPVHRLLLGRVRALDVERGSRLGAGAGSRAQHPGALLRRPRGPTGGG